jgi:ribosomal protein S17
MTTEIENLNKIMESYARLAQSRDQYRESISGGLEAEIQELSGESISNPEEVETQKRKLSALDILVGRREKTTGEHIQSNLGKILSEVDTDKLLFIASQYEHKSSKYGKSCDSFKKYHDIGTSYQIQLIKMGQSVEGFKPSQEEINKYEKDTTELIKQNLRDKGVLKDDKDIEEMAFVIFTLAGENYKFALIQKELKKARDSIENDKDSFIGYVSEGVNEKKDYLKFGSLLYQIYNPKKQ